jgi:hypothetical protein
MGKVRRPSKIVWLGSLLAVGLAIAIAWLLSVLFAPPLGLFSPLGLLWRCPDSVRGNFTFSRDGQLLGYRTPDEFVVRRTKDGREKFGEGSCLVTLFRFAFLCLLKTLWRFTTGGKNFWSSGNCETGK